MYNPSILVSPTLPPILSGKTPAKLAGKKWWDISRKAAYSKYDDCCHACGINKKHTYRKRIEGHELYEIEYTTNTVTLVEVVALCRRCHNFVHIGRLMSQYVQGQVGRRYIQTVVNNGIEVLSKAGIQPLARQGLIWLQFEKGYSIDEAQEYIIKQGLEVDKFYSESWNNWSMIIDGKEYNNLTEIDYECCSD